MQEIYEFLKECNMYYLATIDGNLPRVRPFGTINIFEDKLYIQTSKTKNVSKQMEKNPHIEICGFKDGRWIRVSGKAIRDDRIEAKKSMLDSYPDLRGMYSETDEKTEVLYIDDIKATIYSFTEGLKEINI